MRKPGKDGKQFCRKYGGRVPKTVMGDDVIDREFAACFGSICTAEGVRGNMGGTSVSYP